MVFSGKKPLGLLMGILLGLGGGMAWGAAAEAALAASGVRPYRVLVVIGDQWDDPGSYNIDSARAVGDDFHDVITMLKIWGIPFDILRLDQQRLQINRFLDGTARPNYACVIWMADPDKLTGYSAHYETLRRVVYDYGISLIALFDHIKTPGVAELLGVDYRGPLTTVSQDRAQVLVLSAEHVITAGMAGTIPTRDGQDDLTVLRCNARGNTTVLGTVAGYAQAVVTDLTDDVKTVWIGGGRDWFGKHAAMRQLLRRSLVYCIGYGLFNDTFENALIFTMDDMGASEHAYSLRWHYPTPPKEEIIQYLVEPLARHGLLMVQNVTPGYANPLTRMVENPWTIEPFTDPFGNVQDYGSTKAGLDEGLRRGVFEIQAHRAWTHMTWDLDSPPGPWWDGPLETEMAHGDWYQETYDERRDRPVPASDMRFLYRVGRDAVEKQFGVTPLAVTIRPGTDLAHDNGRLAAIAGYGVDRWHYVGTDYTIQFSITQMCPEHINCHDLDLVARSDSEVTGPLEDLADMATSTLRAAKVVGERQVDLRAKDWIEANKHKRWMGFNEYCAYLHSQVDVLAGQGLEMRFKYDPNYCRHFDTHPSTWTLQLSERYQKKLGRHISLSVDGKGQRRAVSPQQAITLQPGLGTRTVSVQPDVLAEP